MAQHLAHCAAKVSRIRVYLIRIQAVRDISSNYQAGTGPSGAPANADWTSIPRRHPGTGIITDRFFGERTVAAFTEFFLRNLVHV
jgi:hypothetical protein